jgi:hypothetical protein
MLMPLGQYVLLAHRYGRELHWDLLLEAEQGLLTWQLEKDPGLLMASDTATAVSARRLADHRKVYLSYQGPISNGRGSVTRVDEGSYVLQAETQEALRFLIQAKVLRGGFYLRKPSQSNCRGGEVDWVFGRESE